MYADIRTEFELSDSDLFREKLSIEVDELAKRMGDYGDLIRKVAPFGNTFIERMKFTGNLATSCLISSSTWLAMTKPRQLHPS